MKSNAPSTPQMSALFSLECADRFQSALQDRLEAELSRRGTRDGPGGTGSRPVTPPGQREGSETPRGGPARGHGGVDESDDGASLAEDSPRGRVSAPREISQHTRRHL